MFILRFSAKPFHNYCTEQREHSNVIPHNALEIICKSKINTLYNGNLHCMDKEMTL